MSSSKEIVESFQIILKERTVAVSFFVFVALSGLYGMFIVNDPFLKDLVLLLFGVSIIGLLCYFLYLWLNKIQSNQTREANDQEIINAFKKLDDNDRNFISHIKNKVKARRITFKRTYLEFCVSSQRLVDFGIARNIPGTNTHASIEIHKEYYYHPDFK